MIGYPLVLVIWGITLSLLAFGQSFLGFVVVTACLVYMSVVEFVKRKRQRERDT